MTPPRDAPAPRRPSVLIVDDEPLARRLLRRLLDRCGGVGEARECANGLDAKAEIVRFRPDILFLDVEMPGLTGPGLLEGLEPEVRPIVVFTTAYSEHAVKAFELQACDYLLKPFDEARFAKALQRAAGLWAAARAARGECVLAVRQGERTVLLAAREIILISSEDNYIRVRTDGRSYLQRSTLAAAEAALGCADFLRVHRRFLVNLSRLREVRPLDERRLELTFVDGSTAPVSRGRRDQVKAFVARR